MAYIDTDDFLDLFYVASAGQDKQFIDTVEMVVSNTPAADVTKIKHGQWEICCDGYYPYCSNCKTEPQGREMTDYCPHCGAKMDGDKK